jgi:hypothetical protein
LPILACRARRQGLLTYARRRDCLEILESESEVSRATSKPSHGKKEQFHQYSLKNKLHAYKTCASYSLRAVIYGYNHKKLPQRV